MCHFICGFIKQNKKIPKNGFGATLLQHKLVITEIPLLSFSQFYYLFFPSTSHTTYKPSYYPCYNNFHSKKPRQWMIFTCCLQTAEPTVLPADALDSLWMRKGIIGNQCALCVQLRWMLAEQAPGKISEHKSLSSGPFPLQCIPLRLISLYFCLRYIHFSTLQNHLSFF